MQKMLALSFSFKKNNFRFAMASVESGTPNCGGGGYLYPRVCFGIISVTV